MLVIKIKITKLRTILITRDIDMKKIVGIVVFSLLLLTNQGTNANFAHKLHQVINSTYMSDSQLFGTTCFFLVGRAYLAYELSQKKERINKLDNDITTLGQFLDRISNKDNLQSVTNLIHLVDTLNFENETSTEHKVQKKKGLKIALHHYDNIMNAVNIETIHKQKAAQELKSLIVGHLKPLRSIRREYSFASYTVSFCSLLSGMFIMSGINRL